MRTGLLGRIVRGSRAALVSPPVVGAAYVTALAAWSSRSVTAEGADAGGEARAEAVTSFLAGRFPNETTHVKIGVVALALALGIVLGLAADLLVRLRHPAPRRARRSAAGAFVESALLVAVLHAALVAWSMADSPQLYAARWYAQGGLPRTVQVVATDVFGPRGVVLATLALAVVYVRPTRIVYLAQRAAAACRRSARALLDHVGKRAIALVAMLAIGAAAVPDVARPVSDAHAAGIPSAGAPAKVKEGERALPAGERPPNVLLLAAGSLRADRLDARIAPNVTRLAARGTRFDRAYVSMPRTFPSWVSILTGRHGHHHGVRSTFPPREQGAKDFDAMPRRFAQAGYTTAVVTDHAGEVFRRIDLGFERVDAPTFDLRQRVRREVLQRETPLLPILHSRFGRRMFPAMRGAGTASDPMLLADDVELALRSMRDRPFFTTVFFGAAHFPYAGPAPHYARYTDRSYRGRFKYDASPTIGRAAGPAPDADDVRQIQALYDGAVAAVDDAIGRVLRTLERLGLAERTIVVVTADHGETIFDHGRGQGHGDHLFGDEGTHVPLVIYDPRLDAPGKTGAAGEGRRELRLVREVDLAPTLYELTGVTPPSDLDGRSLSPSLRGQPIEPRLAYAETELWFAEDVPGLPSDLRFPYPGARDLIEVDARHEGEIVLREEMAPVTLMARHRMVRDERWKLVYVPTRTGVRYLLFDTANDPSEVHDVAAAHPDEVARLRAELWAWMLEDPSMEQKDGYLVPRGSR